MGNKSEVVPGLRLPSKFMEEMKFEGPFDFHLSYCAIPEILENSDNILWHLVIAPIQQLLQNT